MNKIETNWQEIKPWPTEQKIKKDSFTIFANKDQILKSNRFGRQIWINTDITNKVCKHFSNIDIARSFYNNLKLNGIIVSRDWIE